MARGCAVLLVLLGACAPAAKPAPVVAPPKHAVVHARVGATAAATESDVRASAKEPAVERHASWSRATEAELFVEWAKAAPPLAVEAQVIARTTGGGLDLTITAATPERALFACREVVAGLSTDEERDRQDALTALRAERARVVARLADVTRLLHGFEVQTTDIASARADLARKLASAKAAAADFPGALGAIVEGLEHATKERTSLAASYGPNHPAVVANEAEITLLTAQKEAQEKLEIDAAQSELDALDALPKNKRTPADIAELRRKLLLARLSRENVSAQGGVDVEAPSMLRELALRHLRMRIEIARDAVSYGAAHPKMIAAEAHLAAIESAFAKGLKIALEDLQKKSAPSDDGALRRELDQLIDRLVQILAWEDATVKQAPRLVIVSPCAE
ncbi:MAG: hypothetical protein ACXVEE_26640 [Polyangiales bacterium]